MPRLPATVDAIKAAFPDHASALRALAAVTDREEDTLRSELHEHACFRLFFLLLGHVETASNYEAIASRVQSLLVMPEVGAHGIAGPLALARAHIIASQTQRKLGLFDLPHPLRKSLFEQQNGRCGVCGLKFESRSDSTDTEFEGRPTLDHRIPYRIGGESEANLWILCGRCNSMKSSFVHIGERGRSWISNGVFEDNPKAVAYWTLSRERHCGHCQQGPRDSRMFVVRRHDAGPYVVDNCFAVCETHVGSMRAIKY